MGHYRFDLIDEGGGISQSRYYSCVDDLDALDKAETLCAANAVDVWDGDAPGSASEAGKRHGDAQPTACRAKSFRSRPFLD